MIDNLLIVKSATLNSRFCKHLGVHFKSVSSKLSAMQWLELTVV